MSTSTVPLWGRAWNLSVQYSTQPSTVQPQFVPAPFAEFQTGESTVIVSQDSWEPEALRITFEVLETVLPSPYWFADICIYNLNDSTIQNLLFNATWVTLQAGYQSGNNKSSTIWSGPVLQVLFDRENVVDFKITLHCIASIPLLNNEIINTITGPLTSQNDAVSRMVSQLNLNGGNFAVNMSSKANSLLSAKQYPRGKTLFGRCFSYLQQMADDNNIATYMDGVNASLTELDNAERGVPANVLTYRPPPPPGFVTASQNQAVSQSIIGVPKQTPFGVIFRVLLDPRLIVQNPPLLVQLDRTVISQTPFSYGQVPTPLSSSLIFVAMQIRHAGDSRGNEWYTEVWGYTRTYAQNYLLAVTSANAPT